MKVTDTLVDSALKIENEKIFDLVDNKTVPKHLKECLVKIINDEGFLNFELDTNGLEADGGNFMGELFTAQIRGNTGKGYKEINLFIKSVLPFNSDIGFITLKDVYLREIFVYTELKKIFEELQIKAKVPEKERLVLVKLYETSNEKCLIMDNLITKGLKVPERLAIPSLRFCENAIKQLARFHSLSLVIKKEKPEYFETHIMSKNILIHGNDTWLSMLNNSMTCAIDALQSDNARERLIKYKSSVNLLDKFKYHQDNKGINIGVLCHGDFKTQNILKDDESNGIIPVDYQLTYYGHPVNDIIYFIVCSTDREFRKRHLDSLLSLYYDTMKNYLRYFDINVEDMYPRKQYEQDFKERLDVAVLFGVHYMPLTMAPEENFFDLSMDMTTKKVPHSDLYIRCFNELVEDLINWGIL